MDMEWNPNGDVLAELAKEMAQGLLHKEGGRFSGATALRELGIAQEQASMLDASKDFLDRLSHVVRAVGALSGRKRRCSQEEARRTLEHDLPRMTTSAYWTGYRTLVRKQAVSTDAF